MRGAVQCVVQYGMAVAWPQHQQQCCSTTTTTTTSRSTTSNNNNSSSSNSNSNNNELLRPMCFFANSTHKKIPSFIPGASFRAFPHDDNDDDGDGYVRLMMMTACFVSNLLMTVFLLFSSLFPNTAMPFVPHRPRDMNVAVTWPCAGLQKDREPERCYCYRSGYVV